MSNALFGSSRTMREGMADEVPVQEISARTYTLQPLTGFIPALSRGCERRVANQAL